MKLRRTAVILAISSGLMLSGCARNNLLVNRISAQSYENGQNDYTRVFAWDSDFSAGMGDENGMCAQGALTARAVNYGAALNAVAGRPDISANAALQLAEDVMAINATSTQTAYANLGYFFVCQLALNNMSADTDRQFTTEQVVAMFEHVGETARQINQPASRTSSISARELTAFRAFAEQNGLDLSDVSDEDLAEAIEDADESSSDEEEDGATSDQDAQE